MPAVKLVAEAQSLAAGSTGDGQWRLNAGSEMIVAVPGLNENKEGEAQPIRLVVELASAQFKNPRIVALAEHDGSQVIGYWDAPKVDEAGLHAHLHLTAPRDDREAAVLGEAVRIGAHVRAGVPIQVSVGAQAGPTGTWEKIKAGEKVICNGREYLGGGDDDMPLYILHAGEIYESSIVTFGADSETGRVAATQTKPPVTTKERAMSIDVLKKLIGVHAEKHHSLIARCVAEGLDEVAINQKVQASEMDEKDKKIAELEKRVSDFTAAAAKAKAEEDDQMKMEGAEFPQPDGESKKDSQSLGGLVATRGSERAVKFGAGSDGTTKVQAAASDGKLPKGISSLSGAVKHLMDTKQTQGLVGFKLRAHARRLFPHVEER